MKFFFTSWRENYDLGQQNDIIWIKTTHDENDSNNNIKNNDNNNNNNNNNNDDDDDDDHNGDNHLNNFQKLERIRNKDREGP